MNTKHTHPEHHNQPLTVTPKYQSGLMWFRRDLRLSDNAALFYALKQCATVHLAFVFDTDILNKLSNRSDRRVEFIRESLRELAEQAATFGMVLHAVYGPASTEIPALAQKLNVKSVFANKDYEPYATVRDAQVEHTLKSHNIDFHRFKDHTIFEESEVLSLSGKPYTVFTPYKNAWLKTLTPYYLKPYPSLELLQTYGKQAVQPKIGTNTTAFPIPSLSDMGFTPTNIGQKVQFGERGAQLAWEDFIQRMDAYKLLRDFPARKGVSYLSVHLRFGTISVRTLASTAHQLFTATGSEGAMGWLNELIWRDFYFQILHHRPDATEKAFKPEYDRIEWETGPIAETHFQAWCQGQTGFPLVDAAMRQLNETGYQHNRLRMVTASFLSKDLGLDWRWGEQYFAEQLNDFDLAANNGGWQWAASSGCDAQPYFRIFNPVSQSEKFDPEGQFIRRYCPELAKLPNRWIHAPWLCPPLELQAAGVVLGQNYPLPIVDHATARQKTLERYAVVKKG